MKTKLHIELKIIFVIAFLCGIMFLPSKSFATIVDGVEYSIYNDGSNTMYVSGCDSEISSAVIQSEINGRKVIAIGNSAFKYCSNLTSIIIPTGIEKIGRDAFLGCSNLLNLTIPYGVKTIGIKAFENCTKLKEIDIPDSVTEMVRSVGYLSTYEDGSTFENCTNLQRVKLSANMKGIPTRAFYGCKNLTDVTMQDGITTIDYRAFYGCSALKSIITSNNIEIINGGAFDGCTSLEYAKIPSKTKFSETTTIGSNYHWPIFENCPNLVLDVVQDSPAEIYAINNNINYTIYAYPMKVVSVDAIQDYIYTGDKIKPEVVVKHNEKTLNNGEDYILIYSNNKDVGTAVIVIRGIGKYEGTTSISFRIIGKDINNTTITCTESQQYTGSSIIPKITVKDEDLFLEERRNYLVSYENNINAGIATATITGIGNYTGSKIINFTIIKATYDMSNVQFNNVTTTYDRNVHSIEATGLPNGVTVSYENNEKTNVGKYEVIAKFTGDTNNYETIENKTATLTINAKDLSKTKISIDSLEKKYTGNEIKPKVAVKDGNIILKNGTDYIASYKNNINTGKATITITGKGNYVGTKVITFNIIPSQVMNLKLKSQKKNEITLQWSKNDGNVSGYKVYKYNSKTKKWNYAGKTSNTNYTIKKLAAGTTYKYRVSAYKTIDGTQYFGSYSSTLTASTLPSTTKITKLVTKNKKVTIKWNKVSNATGYEIYMSTRKNKGYSKIKNITKKATVSYTKGNLKKNKTYYFKIRTYRTVNGKKVYSSYSNIKSIKAK